VEIVLDALPLIHGVPFPSPICSDRLPIVVFTDILRVHLDSVKAHLFHMTPEDEANSIGARLSGERHRLGLTQEQFAKLGGVQRRAQAHYEAGKRTPDANYLAAISEGGVDVVYLLTGRREHQSINFDLLGSVFIAIERWELEEDVNLKAYQRARITEAAYRVALERGSVTNEIVEILARLAVAYQEPAVAKKS